MKRNRLVFVVAPLITLAATPAVTVHSVFAAGNSGSTDTTSTTTFAQNRPKHRLRIYRSLPCFSRLRIHRNSVLLTPKRCAAQISVNATAIDPARLRKRPIRLKTGDTLKLLDQHTVRSYRLLTVGDAHARFAYRSFWWGVAGSGQRRETIVTRTYSQYIPK